MTSKGVVRGMNQARNPIRELASGLFRANTILAMALGRKLQVTQLDDRQDSNYPFVAELSAQKRISIILADIISMHAVARDISSFFSD